MFSASLMLEAVLLTSRAAFPGLACLSPGPEEGVECGVPGKVGNPDDLALVVQIPGRCFRQPRPYVLSGEVSKAKSSYQDFFALWKDADVDMPILNRRKQGTPNWGSRIATSETGRDQSPVLIL